MTASPKAITSIEYTWARATLGTIYPACPEAGVTQGITDMDLAAHIDDMDDVLPWLTFFGLRMFLLIIALSPLFAIGKFGTMAGLEQKDRDAVIGRLGHSNIYLVRQMVMALKATFAMFFAGGEELQAICRSQEPNRAKLVSLGRKNAA
jgi:hypothetical protein